MFINFLHLIKNIKTNWAGILLRIYITHKDDMLTLSHKIETDYQTYDGYFQICPPPPLIFNAFNHFYFEDLKIVIIGQDPYHGKGQAMGLSFSVPHDVPIPPSLNNIYKELGDEFPDFKLPTSGDLTPWAKQGVLLLNASLTVREMTPNSHATMWQETHFVDDIITYISEHHRGIIFMLWGNFAKSKKKLIHETRHYILEGAHPSPLSQAKWFGNNHFKMANEILTKDNRSPINWQIE